MNKDHITIDATLVHRLIVNQFPQWKDLPIIMDEFAISLACFLKELQCIDIIDGPSPGSHNFYRGGALATYDSEARQAIYFLKDIIDAAHAEKIWEKALSYTWQKRPVWIHGDFSFDNLLIE